MKYRDRRGNEFEQTTAQDEFLARMYTSTVGRVCMKITSLPIFSKLSRLFLDSRFSSYFVLRFAERNDIDIFDYENKLYYSFNDFFTRRIKPGRRRIDSGKDIVISPSDGKVSAYEITASGVFVVKNSVYTVESLLRDTKLAKKYLGGTAFIIRLTPDDYHRYCYCTDGEKSRDRCIKGFLHTVNPIINKYIPVYKENSREYCMIRTKGIGDVIQMEVGAMFVGRISNKHPYGRRIVRKGEEKGFFEFGGSTIILLTEKGRITADEDLLINTREGFETKILQGETIGRKLPK
ncbi:MAG: phosphatidylserine decarboxylase [Ruminococcus sp.]|nr:phosphatidylserine decarboxylase [Ruminococcus sp.]